MDFLADLFAAMAGPDLCAAGLPASAVAHLVAIQFQGQSETYRAQFPDARHFVLERDGRPVGRLVVDREASDLYVVDIAVSPEKQGSGTGGAAIAEVQHEASAAGVGVRALVFPHNLRSMAMFRRLNFIVTGRTVGPSLELRWTA
ncbi:MAG: GNAT family N-acetyltransferase [Janthinobacterium lividum]